MTPNDIEVLIHCHVSPVLHPRIDAGAVKEALARFLNCGLIEGFGDVSNAYQTTDKGAAHIQQLCNLPFPTVKYVTASGEVIE